MPIAIGRQQQAAGRLAGTSSRSSPGLRSREEGAVKKLLLRGFAFMKSTQSGSENYVKDGLVHPDPNFSCNSGHSRSGLNGVAVKRMPVALAMALPSAAATGLYGLSLIDLAPIGPSVSDVSAKNTSVRGMSAKDGR